MPGMSHLISRVLDRLERKGQRTISEQEIEATRPGGPWGRVFRRAVEVFGSEEAAAKWMDEEAIGLPDRKPPSAFLGSREGVEMVEDYLGRIEYGVYT